VRASQIRASHARIPRSISFLLNLLERTWFCLARAGYYAGRVPGKKAAAGEQSSAADQASKEPGFLASW